MSAIADATRPDRPARWPELFWSSAELEERGTWRRTLPRDVRDEFLANVARAEGGPAVADFSFRAERWPQLLRFADDVRRQLLEGDGLQRVRGLAELGLDDEGMRRCYAAFGHALGRPLLHYGLLYPVVDRGKDHTTQAVPVSMTGAETCYHTDSSAVGVVPDFVGLLCEQPSDNGGDSLVSNAGRAYAHLAQHEPELLAELRRPFIRDVVTPGRPRTHESLLQNRFPVFADSERPGGILFRYMRYWIEVGQEKAGLPLNERQIAALDRLDELLQDPAHAVGFRLERGDVVWVNNRVLAHNRTAFRDTPGNVRRLQRMWIETPA